MITAVTVVMLACCSAEIQYSTDVKNVTNALTMAVSDVPLIANSNSTVLTAVIHFTITVVHITKTVVTHLTTAVKHLTTAVTHP
jgi:hypothetical protein